VDEFRLTRRAVLRGGGVVALALFAPRWAGAPVAVAMEGGPRFLTDAELETLRGVVDRFIPGPPEDPDPGAVEAGCAEAIDALLGTFEVDPPRIYAGAPFSDRGGWPRNEFEEFLPLDPYETLAWRLRIQGSGGRPELERNGPLPGFQQVYREGLAAAEDAAGDASFAELPAPAREMILRSDDPAITALVDVAFVHTLELMYGAPEYGGNRDLLGWEFTGFMGDTQPRGWTREEVENPDQPGLPEAEPRLPDGMDPATVRAVAPLGSAELYHGLMARSDGRLSVLRAEIEKLTGGSDGR
jgi:hypothetical protein